MYERIYKFVWLIGYDRLLTNHHKSMKGLGRVDCAFQGCVCENATHVFRVCQRSR